MKYFNENFCRENGLPVSGGNIEITDRIAYFLDTGKAMPAKAVKRSAANISNITEVVFIQHSFSKLVKKQLQGHNCYERKDLIEIE